jgi:hypothetical protein
MIPTLTFRSPVPDAPRQVAYLGEVLTGEVFPVPGRHQWRATWIVYLTDVPRRHQPVASLKVAREKLQEAVEQWLMRAHLLDYGQQVTVEIVEPEKRKRVKA